MLPYLIFFLCLALTLIIGALTLFQNNKSTANKLFAGFALGTVSWMISLQSGFYLASPENIKLVNFFFRLSFGSGVVSIFLLTYFFYIFPRKTVVFPKIVEYLYSLSTLGLLLFTVFTPYIYESVILAGNGEFPDILGKYYPLVIGFALFSYLIQIYLSIKKIFITSGIERKKIVLAFTGLSLFIFFVALTNGILPLFGVTIFQSEAVIFSLLFLIPAFYSIQKFRFFDFSNTSLNILRYFIIVCIFVLSTFIIEYLFEFFIPGGSRFLIHIESAVVSLLLFIRLEKTFPEFTTSSFRELKSQLNQLKANIYYCNNYQDLISKIEKTFVVNLHYTTAKLFIVRDKKNKIDIPLYVKDGFTQDIEKQRLKILIKEELKMQKNDFFAEHMEKLNMSVCFPIYLDAKIIGLFVIGNKAEHDDFSREEIDELFKTKQAIENCFINILLQSDLKEENDLIKQFINQKTKNLKKQNEKINDLLSKQSDFIAVTAHEFRTPLNIALLQLEDTLDSYEHSSQVLDDMKSLENSLDKLKTLTQNLFDVQEYDLDKTKLYSKKVNIADFMNEAYEELKNIVAKKNIDLSFENLAGKNQTISIDEPKMRQVVYNLITNAQKFVPEKGKIIIRIEVKDAILKISIIDNGPGVPANLKKRIFSKFQTSHTQNGSGIGLGLYLCKKIVELHNGKIEISDTPGGGATFTIILPTESKPSKPKENIKPVKQSPNLKLAKAIK